MDTVIPTIGGRRSHSSSDPATDGVDITGVVTTVAATIIEAEATTAIANAVSLARFFRKAAAWFFPIRRGAPWIIPCRRD